MRSKPLKLTVRPVSYFEHIERQHNPRATAFDVIEWTEGPPSPPVVVEETDNPWLIAKVKRLWQNRIKESHK